MSTGGADTERLHILAFPATRGKTKGVFVSLELFNVLVDNFIITCLAMTLEEQRVDHDGLRDTVGRCLGVFYDENGMVDSRNPDCLQHATNVLLGLFRRYGLVANVKKSRIMTCQPGALQAGMSEEAMALKFTGVGDSYWVRL